MLQKSQKQQKIVDKTGLLRVFYLIKAENCATNNVSQCNLSNTRKVSFLEIFSKLQNIFFNHMPAILSRWRDNSFVPKGFLSVVLDYYFAVGVLGFWARDEF